MLNQAALYLGILQLTEFLEGLAICYILSCINFRCFLKKRFPIFLIFCSTYSLGIQKCGKKKMTFFNGLWRQPDSKCSGFRDPTSNVWKDLNHSSICISISKGQQHFKGRFCPLKMTSFTQDLFSKDAVFIFCNCTYKNL